MRAKKKAPPAESSEDSPSGPAKKPVTFEDLLKEFGVEQVEEEKPQHIEVIEEVEEEVAETQRPQYSDEESKSIFEKSIRDAEMAVESTVPSKEKKLVFEEFEPYQEAEEREMFTGEVREMLRSADGAKKAVILSEILNRKYS